MDGERCTKLYIQAVLGGHPDLIDEEEKECFNKLVLEIEETRKQDGDKFMWVIPDD